MIAPLDRPVRVDAVAIRDHALVVEDNRANQAVVGAILQSLGFIVSFAADGEEAVAAVRKNEFDVILMDIHMPVKDGFKATREIRDLGGWCSTVPIIAVTANEMAKERKAYVAAGLDDLISKPIDSRQFAETVLRHMAASDD